MVLSLVLVIALTALGLLAVGVLHRAMADSVVPVRVLPAAAGRLPEQHALSRFHPRWYAASVVFLAFDVEMLFMYPWALVVADLGAGAVVEMFVFLGVLLAAVAWASREGAFRWA